MQKTVNKFLMSRGSKSTRHNDLTKQLHSEKEPNSNAAKERMGQYCIVKLFSWSNFCVLL